MVDWFFFSVTPWLAVPGDLGWIWRGGGRRRGLLRMRLGPNHAPRGRRALEAGSSTGHSIINGYCDRSVSYLEVSLSRPGVLFFTASVSTYVFIALMPELTEIYVRFMTATTPHGV